ncbi:MAG: CocE/NonD family hydrolase [Solirubrobacteraceae bacterium]
MIVERDVRVAMRDGVSLATDVYRPDGGGAHPALMHRTPYGRAHPLYLHGTAIDVIGAVEDGYAVVSQDTRGRFDSGGEWNPFRHEADDGFDTVEWLALQDWCDGRVGAYGTSYNGATALHVAVGKPRHLVAVLSYMAGTSYDDGWVYSGGAFELGFAVFWLTRGAWETLRRGDVPQARREQLARLLREVAALPRRIVDRLPVSELPGFEPELVPFWRDWLEHPPGNDYWREIDVAAQAEQIEVPVLHISGLYDNLLGGHLALNEALKRHSSPLVREQHRFVLGPWDHEAYQSSRPNAAGDYDFGPQAPNAYGLMRTMSREWFDRWLRGRDAPLLATPRASYFRTGAESWEQADAWPPAREPTALHLASGGHANTRAGDGMLVWEAPAGEQPPDSFRYDPWNPVPSNGGRTLAPVFGTAGIHDQASIEDRPDVLVYTSEALGRELVLAGEASLVLFASSSCVDTDFTAKLVDVEPDGYCRNLAAGIVRARYRAGDGGESWLTLEEPTELRIDLRAISHAFAPAHRIRLEVSSSNFPTYDRNLNSQAHPAFGGESDVRVALQRVLHDEQHPTRLLLPVLSAPAGA